MRNGAPTVIERTTQERSINFIADVINSRFPIPYRKYMDREEWGCDRTFRRLRTNVNDLWSRRTGHPLFKIVDAEGRETTKNLAESFILRI